MTGSKEVAKAALMMSVSSGRDEERALILAYARQEIKAAAVDFGGEYISSVMKMVERAVVAARREEVIADTHSEQGAVAGAAREAIAQIMNKALGLNVGGKIGIARYNDHVVVAVFFGIGLLHLNEVAVGIGHRVI
ncbi:MAG: HutP family protein [Bacillota bacterium]